MFSQPLTLSLKTWTHVFVTWFGQIESIIVCYQRLSHRSVISKSAHGLSCARDCGSPSTDWRHLSVSHQILRTYIHIPPRTGSQHYIAQPAFTLALLPSEPLQSWDYKMHKDVWPLHMIVEEATLLSTLEKILEENASLCTLSMNTPACIWDILISINNYW